MADKKLSELPLVSAVSGLDELLLDGDKRIKVSAFGDSLAGSNVTCAVTGGPNINHGYPVVTGNVRLKNRTAGTLEGLVVQIYFGSSSADSWRLDGQTTTDANGAFTYDAKPKGDGVRTVQARLGEVWSLPYTLTTDQVDVAATSIVAAIDWVMEGLAQNTVITRLDVEGGIVGDAFDFTMLDSVGNRFALSGDKLVQGATAITHASSATRTPRIRATSRYTNLSIDIDVVMRVFAEPDWMAEPAAASPSALGLNILLDVNPASGNINGGSPTDGGAINSALFDGKNAAGTAKRYAFSSVATAGYKPKWIASAAGGNPCIRVETNNQGLKSTEAELLALFNTDHPVLTVITVYKQTAITGGTQFVFSVRQATTVGNPSGQRLIQRGDNGHVGMYLGDDLAAGSISSASATGATVAAVNDTVCTFVMNGAMQGCGLERDFDYTTRYGSHNKTGHPFSDTTTGAVDVTIADKGGQAAGAVGDYYRVFVIAGVPTLRQRYAICKWAHAQFGLTRPPAWAPYDMTGKATVYDMDAHTSGGIYELVKHGEVRGGLPGSEDPAKLGFQSLPSGSTSTQYAGWINNSEDTGFINILDPLWRDQVADPNDSDVWHIWQNMVVGETKVCPVGFEPYVLLNGVQKTYIGPMLTGRYGGPRYLHGQMSGEYWMSQPSRGGKGMWGGVWSLGDAAASSSATYNEQDLQEQDGADIYGLHTTTHDGSISGGQSGHYFVVDDQTQGINWVLCDVQPDYMAYYFNGILMWRVQTQLRQQGSKFPLLDCTTGKTPGAFFGAVDGTTVFPNFNVFRKVKITRNAIAAPTVIGSTPVEASDLIARMTSPTATEQAVIINAIKQFKGYSARYPDGNDYTLFAKLNYLYLLAMQASGNTRFDWKLASRNAATILGAPTFTAGQGYKGNAPGDYIDTGIYMPTAGFANNAADQTMGVWNLTQPSSYQYRFAHGDDKYQVNPSPQTTNTGKTNTLFLTAGQSGVEVLYNDIGPGCHVWSRGYGMLTPWFNGKINGILSNQSTTSLDATPAWASTNNRRILSSSLNTTAATYYDGKVAAAWATAWLTEDHHVKMYDILHEALTTLGAV